MDTVMPSTIAKRSTLSRHAVAAAVGALWLLSACSSGQQATGSAATPTALAQPATESAPESTATPTRTASPTPGPDLTALLGTPNARAAAADLDGAAADYEALAAIYPHSAEPLLG